MEGVFLGAAAGLLVELILLILAIRMRKKMASWLAVFFYLFLGFLIMLTVVFLGALGFFLR